MSSWRKPSTPMEYKKWRLYQGKNKQQQQQHSLPQLDNNKPSKLDSISVETKENIIPTGNLALDWTTLSDNLSLLSHHPSKTTSNKTTEEQTVDIGRAKQQEQQPYTKTMEQLTVPLDISLKKAIKLELVLQDSTSMLDWIRNQIELLCCQNIFYSSNSNETEKSKNHVVSLIETLRQVATVYVYPLVEDHRTLVDQDNTVSGSWKDLSSHHLYSYDHHHAIANKNTIRYDPKQVVASGESEDSLRESKTWQLAFHSAYQQWRLGNNQFIYLIFENFVITFVSFNSQNNESFLAITANVPTRIQQALNAAGFQGKQMSCNNRMQLGQDLAKEQVFVFQGHSQVHLFYQLLWNEVPYWRKLFLKTFPIIVSEKEFLYCSMTCADIRLDKSHNDSQISLKLVGILLPASLYKLYDQLVANTFLTRWNIQLETDKRTLGSNKAIPKDVLDSQFRQHLAYPISNNNSCGEECFALVDSLGKNDQQQYKLEIHKQTRYIYIYRIEK